MNIDFKKIIFYDKILVGHRNLTQKLLKMMKAHISTVHKLFQKAVHLDY